MALYKRPGSKYWWMKFTFAGELVQKSTNVANKRDAQTVESAYRTQLALGKIGIEPKKEVPTFAKATEDFLKWSKVEHSNQLATYKRYYYSSEILKAYFGKTKADRIKPKDVENYIIWRSSQKSRKTGDYITRETVNHELLTLKIIFNRLIDARILPDNPARKIKQLKSNERQFHVLTYDEEKRYLFACPQPLRDVATLMLETGMRCGEVYRLRRQDVYLEKEYLKIVKGKTKSSVRQLHLPKTSRKILSRRIKKFTGEFLFPQNEKDGNPATASLDYQHRTAIKDLKFKFRLYDCRHTFATRAVESGVDLLVLASLLGHSGLRMVTRYAHPSETHKKDAIKRMENHKAKAV